MIPGASGGACSLGAGKICLDGKLCEDPDKKMKTSGHNNMARTLTLT